MVYYGDSARRLIVDEGFFSLEVDDLFFYCYDKVKGEEELATVFPIGRLKMIENLDFVPTSSVARLTLVS